MLGRCHGYASRREMKDRMAPEPIVRGHRRFDGERSESPKPAFPKTAERAC